MDPVLPGSPVRPLPSVSSPGLLQFRRPDTPAADTSVKNRANGLVFVLLLAVAGLLLPAQAVARMNYLSDILDTFTDTSHMDVCGDCHASWSGAKSRGDLAVNYKLWDFNLDTAGMTPALRKVDMFNIGFSNEWRIANESSGGQSNPAGEPYPFSGAGDKDGDGYINLIYRTERAGMPINLNDICATCNKTGGNTGALPDPPYGWDVDDNDATQGNVPWDWADMLSDAVSVNGVDAGATTQEKLKSFFSSDYIKPQPIEDLRLDIAAIDDPALNPNSTGSMPSDRLPVTWTAPADDNPDDPLNFPANVALTEPTPDTFKPVHHYDLRYTTELILTNYNNNTSLGYAADRCSSSREVGGPDPCFIRNPDHWHNMGHISDCGINGGGIQEYLAHLGPSDSKACAVNGSATGQFGWNHGIAAPLMRALYETGVEDYDGIVNTTKPTDQSDCLVGGLDPGCYPHGPRTPGDTERYILREVSKKLIDPSTGLPYTTITDQFGYTDVHDGTLATQPNYVAPGTVYWMHMLSDDAIVHPCVEATGDERISVVGDDLATSFCQPDAGDTVINGGPFTEADGGGIGFHSYHDTGFQEHGNIIAMKSGGGTLLDGTTAIAGIGISGYSSTSEDSSVSPATVTIDGVGFADYFGAAAKVGPGPASIVLTNTTAPYDEIKATGTSIALDGTTPDRKLTVSFDISALSGEYTLEIRDQDGVLAAAVVHAFDIASTATGSIRLAASGIFSVAENDPTGTGVVGVERFNGSNGIITVDLDTTDGSATAGVDYTALSGAARTVTFDDGVQGTISVPVTILDDGDPEPDETIDLTLSNTTLDGTVDATLLSTPSTGTLTITNDDADPGYVTFTVSSFSENEISGGAIAVIDVVRSIGFDGTVTVDYGTADGNNADPTLNAVTTGVTDNSTGEYDYVPTSGTIGWVQADGSDANQSFNVSINDDAIEESSESLRLILSNRTGGVLFIDPLTGALLDDTVVTIEVPLTILDDDTPATLDIDTATYTYNENVGTVTVNVVRSGSLTDVVSVSYLTTDGTAVSGGSAALGTDDYVPVTVSGSQTGAQTASWVAGEGGSKTMAITINEDVLDEVDSENFRVTLDPGSVSGNAVIGTTNFTDVSITDNDTVLQIGSATYTVDENGVSLSINVVRTDLSNTFPGNVSVQYYTTDGTAESTGLTDNSNGDYDFVPVTLPSPLVSFADGDTVTTTQTVTIAINDDSVLEGSESFLVTLANETGDSLGQVEIGAQASTSVDIVDDEAPGVVRFVSADYTQIEDDPSTSLATISVERVDGSTGIATVTWATSDGSAVTTDALLDSSTGDYDYVPDTNTLQWADGASGTQTFTVTVNNDAIDEDPDELFNLTLSNPLLNTGSGDTSYPALLTAEGTTTTPRATATATIEDSHGVLQIDSLSESVAEDGADGVVATTTLTVNVTRVGGSNGIASINYLTTDGTAVSTGADNSAGLRDFEPILTTALNWTDGNTTGATQSFTVTINNDSTDEPDESFTADINTASGVWLDAAKDSVTITIVDSVGYIEFSTISFQQQEDNGSGQTTGVVATIRVSRLGGSNGGASVAFAVADGDSANPAVLVEATNVNGLRDYELSATPSPLTWLDNESGELTFTVPINYDTIIEATEDVNLSLNTFVGAWQGGISTADLDIIDSVGRFEYVGAPYSNDEDTAGNYPITVQRVEGSGGDYTLPYSVTDGTATTVDSDYGTPAGTLAWVAGEVGSKSFVIPITVDRNIETDETVNIAVTPPYGLDLTTTLTLLNDDYAGTVQYQNLPNTVDEDVVGGIFTVSVERVNGDVGALDVNFATSDGTALAGFDYAATSGTLSWTDTDTAPKTFPITITNDTDLELGDGETINVTLSGLSGGSNAAIGAPNPSTLTIIDDESPGEIQFTAVDFSVVEDDPVGYATITVVRAGGSAGEATVDYTTAVGGAYPADGGGVDFDDTSGTAATSTALTWADGIAGEQQFTVPITLDTLTEDPDETVLLQLSNVTGAVAGSWLDATLTIIDSYGTVQFDAPTYSVIEDGTAGVAVVTVTRSGGSNQIASVTFSTADGAVTPALSTSDYTATTQTVSWGDGNTDPQTVTIPINNDSTDEPDETIDIALSAPNNSWLGSQNTGTVTIIDSLGTLQFDITNTTSVVEDDPTSGGTVTVNVTRVGGSNGEAWVDYSALDGTARVVDADYALTAGTLYWPDGDRDSKPFEVTISDDSLDEADETFSVSLSNPLSSLGASLLNLGSPSTQAMTIVDSYGKLQFSSTTYSVNEDGITALVTVDRSGGNNGAAAISYVTSDLTAQAGSDYTAHSLTPLSWNDGDGSSREISINITDDALNEGDESFNVTLSAESGGWLGTLNPAVVTILDQPGTVQFKQAIFSVDENGATATIFVSRSGGAGGSASVTYATADGSAQDDIGAGAGGGDFDGDTNTLSWGPGDFADKSFTVAINPDNLSEGTETVNLTLSAPSGAALGSQWQSTLEISDDPGKIQFSASNYSVSEDGTLTADITVQRVEGRGGAAAVNYATDDTALITPKATVGTDYSAASGTLNWADNDAADKTFPVTIVYDTEVEDPDEKIALALSGFSGAIGGAPQAAELVIIDGAGSIGFVSPTDSVDEFLLSKSIPVQRLGGSNGAASVTFAISGGTASSSEPDNSNGLRDYEPLATTTLSWIDGEAGSKNINLTLNDDTIVEGDETIDLALTSSSGAPIDGSSAAHVLTILEDDIAGVFAFFVANFTAYEDVSALTYAEITVNRGGGSIGAVTVDVAVSDGTAVSTELDNSNGLRDFEPEVRTLSWGAGDATPKSFNVTINPDAVIEAAIGGEVVNLTLGLTGTSNGATLGAQNTAQLHIIDSVGSLRFTAADFPVNESDGTANVTVERVFGSGGAVSVDFLTSDGSAFATADYTATSGTDAAGTALTWASGNTSTQSIPISILNDTDIESAEYFDVFLANPLGGATLTGTNPVTVTITSDDATGSIRFSSATYSDFEDVGLITVALQRAGGSVGEIAITYQTTADTAGVNPATAGTDYTVIDPTRVVWTDTDGADKSFSVIIPAGDIDFEADETLLITLSNPEGTTTTTPDTAVITITNDDSATLSTLDVNPGWHMISVPTDLATNNDAVSLFGDDLGWPTVFIFKRVSTGLNPGSFAGTYQTASTLIPGEGYFFENNRTVSITLDDQFNGLQTTDPYEIQLQVGGGMFGNPFQNDIDVKTDVRICNYTLSASVPQCSQDADWISWSAAASSPNFWIIGTIYRYNSAGTAYDMSNPSDANMWMKPWEGFWVRTETTDVLKLRFYDAATPPP